MVSVCGVGANVRFRGQLPGGALRRAQVVVLRRRGGCVRPTPDAQNDACVTTARPLQPPQAEGAVQADVCPDPCTDPTRAVPAHFRALNLVAHGVLGWIRVRRSNCPHLQHLQWDRTHLPALEGLVPHADSLWKGAVVGTPVTTSSSQRGDMRLMALGKGSCGERGERSGVTARCGVAAW